MTAPPASLIGEDCSSTDIQKVEYAGHSAKRCSRATQSRELAADLEFAHAIVSDRAAED